MYSVMPTQLALCLASKHNRASTFCHEMTTWDKVIICIDYIINLHNYTILFFVVTFVSVEAGSTLSFILV